MERVKEAIASTTNKLRSQVEESQKAGKVPAAYSLGFTNAMIFADHHVNMRDGQPKFYDESTSVGSMPKPSPLRTDQAIKEDQEFEFLQDQILTAARGLTDAIKYNADTKEIEIDQNTVLGILGLKKNVDEFDNFITDKVTAEELEREAANGQNEKDETSKQEGQSAEGARESVADARRA
jgi:hypothetical protein